MARRKGWPADPATVADAAAAKNSRRLNMGVNPSEASEELEFTAFVRFGKNDRDRAEKLPRW
jgi:hypothetical protein